jgi:hypothetical protein
MNRFHLAVIATLCWAASMGLSFFGTFKMAQLVKTTDEVINRVANNTQLWVDLTDIKNDIYTASRVEGIGTDVIFLIICMYIFGNSLQYIKNWLERASACTGHKLFWFALILDLVGFGACFEGFAQYGGQNPQNATAFISSGMALVAFASWLIIRRYEETLDVIPGGPQYNFEGYNPGGITPIQNQYIPPGFSRDGNVLV